VRQSRQDQEPLAMGHFVSPQWHSGINDRNAQFPVTLYAHKPAKSASPSIPSALLLSEGEVHKLKNPETGKAKPNQARPINRQDKSPR
ncbi:MAG: hypothetical protein QGG45_21425, partial [Alphaproteobacteria bacterium]|nr:hypothetical protein [Alphaproteobacteria bacterium]